MEYWKKIAQAVVPNEFNAFVGSSDARRPDSVRFTDIATDVKRRDLTINALFFDIDTEEIVDLVGGAQDLKDKVVRTVGSAEARFGEDRLRILRAIRFAARFGSDLDIEIREALKKDSSLAGISGERIRDEFLKGLKSAKHVEHFLVMLREFDLFKWIFKGLKVSDDMVSHKDSLVLMAVLLHENEPKKIDKALGDSKFTVDERRAVSFLVSLQGLSEETVIRFKKAEKTAGVSARQIGMFGGKMGIEPSLLRRFVIFEFSVSGEAVMAERGIGPGKELGDVIHQMELERFKQIK